MLRYFSILNHSYVPGLRLSPAFLIVHRRLCARLFALQSRSAPRLFYPCVLPSVSRASILQSFRFEVGLSRTPSTLHQFSRRKNLLNWPSLKKNFFFFASADADAALSIRNCSIRCLHRCSSSSTFSRTVLQRPSTIDYVLSPQIQAGLGTFLRSKSQCVHT